MNEELRIIIRAELEQFKKAMSEAVSGIKQVSNASKKASKEIDGFTADVNQQGKALQDLKKKYVDLAAAHGKESKAAKDAAEQIKKLSAEYKTNKNLAADLANEANSFDASLVGEDTNKNVEATNESIGELQGTLQGMLALNVWDFVGNHIEKWTEKTKQFSETAKDSFSLAGIYFKQGFGELFRDEETMVQLDLWGESFTDSVKGSMESAKYGFQELGKAMTETFKMIGAAIVASAAIIIADLVVIIGLAKNALSVAKEIKAMSSDASKSGMDTSTYQEWGYVLKQSGVEADKLSDFTKKLAERQNELRDGSEEVAKAFEDIGISQEEVLNSNQEELFGKTVAALQNIENESERTSASFRVFSDDATDLTNLLYLTNQETKSLVDNYYALGGAPSDNLINKSKILAGSTTNLSYAWQGLRNTLAEWVIPAVITVVQWLTTAVAYVNAFLQGVFGVEMGGKKAAQGLSAVGDGANKVGSSADNATKKLKELQRYTMGFDELNVVPSQNSGSDSGSGSGAMGASGFSGTNINPEIPVIEVPDMSKFRAFIEEYGSLIQGLLTWGAILGGLAMVVGGVMSGNIPLVVAGASIIGLGIAVGAAGGEESHWAKFAEGAMSIFGGFFESLKTMWDAICNLFSSAWEFIKVVWSGVKPFFDVWWEYIKLVFTVGGGIIVGALVMSWEAIKVVWDVATGYFAAIWNTIAYVFSFATSILSGDFQGAWDAIRGIVDTWTGYFANIWESIKGAFGNVAEWFTNVFSKAWEGVKNVFSTGGKIFMGIVDGITNVFKIIVNGIITGLNAVIKVPFDGINAALRGVKGVSIAGIKPFDWIKEIYVPQIPKLAKGGIATSSILANIGERGREAVLPLENNTGWMDILADRIASRNNTPSRIVLMVDGRELGYAAINSINGITKQTGVLQLQLV